MLFALQNFTGNSALAVFTLSAAIVLCLGFYILLVSSRNRFAANAPQPVREGYPILGAMRFFTARWDFFQHARTQTPSGNFSFHIGKHQVVGLSGDKARQFFFDNRELDFAAGYAVLFGQSPNSLKEDGVAHDKEFSGSNAYFGRRLTRLLSTDYFNKGLDTMLSDVKSSLEQLANEPSGITNPFESLYKVVFQITMRKVGCDDIADDPELLDTTLRLFETVESSATATAIMFPWFPSPAVVKRTIAGGRLYMIIRKIVEERKKTGKRGDDPLQYLIDEGDDVRRMVEFIIGALFAGLLNSGINVAWVLVYLAKDSYWLSKAREEVEKVAAKHSNNKDAPLIEQLSQLTLEQWESEFPLQDLFLKESIRLQLLGTAFRRNVSGRDIPIGNGNEVIPPGAVVTYHTADIHLDPTIYKDPEQWDPSRFLPGRTEDSKKKYAYIGWGVGRHPCLGMRWAKLEQTVTIAFFLAMFDFELSDKAGNPVKDTPTVDFNGHSATKPSRTPYLKYTRRK